MLRRTLSLVVALGLGACGVRAPSPIDTAALVRAKGAIEARRSLEVRVIAEPRDVQAHLALAAIADEQGRPSQAIAHLEIVLALGGPIGTRWHASDRARLARLLVERGRARLARRSPTAERDLLRAHELGARIDDALLREALRAVALARLAHVDARERASGKRIFAEVGEGAPGRGARVGALGPDRGAFGAYLWQIGARRAAWDELSAWHAATQAPRDPALVAAYLQARAWWTPLDGAQPHAAELVGPERCRFAVAKCRASLDPALRDALVAGPSIPTRDPDEASAWTAITLRESLRGRGSWGALLAARVDLANVDEAALAPFARPAIALFRGELRAEPEAIAEPGPDERLVVAAVRVLRSSDDAALLQIVEPRAPRTTQRPFVDAAAAYAHARTGGASVERLAVVVEAYLGNPERADQRAADVVATAVDGALAHAALGALYDALGDPARARAAWQAAVDDSAEPAFQRGLAIALARANDPDAALVIATAASAASGDPAPVWLDVARALHDTGKHVHAIEAARFAIELAGPEVYAPALDLAIAANRALGRPLQVESLTRRRAAAFHPIGIAPPHDPTDPARAVESNEPARLWTASRWNARDVATRAALLRALAADDARLAIVRGELVELAVDSDETVARRAVAALRPTR